MAPVSKSKGRDGRSRNTTPLSTTSTEPTSAGPPSALSNMSYNDILNRYSTSTTPSSDQLKKIKEAIQACSDVSKARSEAHDKGMRESTRRKKEEVERRREQEMLEREEEERKEKMKRNKSRKDREEDRPLAVGAHAVARQDGVPEDEAKDKKESPSAPTQASPKEQEPEGSPAPSDSTAESHQPRPAPAIPQYQTFGPDPLAFDDPTIYHIREVYEGMDEDEKKEILGVADYPHDDLYELTAGTAPDRDLTNVKPANQVTAQTFAHYLEPYFRPFTEEDIAFLKERGDRSAPMVIPRRGPRSYKEVWAEEDRQAFEDGMLNTPQQASTNQAQGSIEQMNEEAAETSEISVGPMLSRLMQCLVPERRAPLADGTSSANVNGDSAHLVNGDAEGLMENGIDEQPARPLPPATHLADSNQPNVKSANTKMAWSEMDDRLKLELKHIGFLSEDAEPDYDGHHDDEVAARLRYLQDELQRVSILNGARKARVLELVEDSMAQQEWSQIADDLDTQLNQAYLKRHRNIGKGKHKLKRPGGAGGGSHAVPGAGISKPSIGEPIRALMDRRHQWNTTIGPVVDFGKKEVPHSSIFDDESMKRLMAKERELWSEAQEHS